MNLALGAPSQGAPVDEGGSAICTGGCGAVASRAETRKGLFRRLSLHHEWDEKKKEREDPQHQL